MRAIDADELFGMESILATAAHNPESRVLMDQVLYDIQHVPAIDAVPVVRCKDCKHRGDLYRCPMRTLVMPGQGPGTVEDRAEDEGFCHMGAKMDGGAKDGKNA